jgi:cell division protein ZapA (FtsZ GTPase activity inhibitor)
VTPRRPPARNTVTVEIGGERHVLRSDVSAEYTRAVAQHLDEAMRSLPSFPTLEPFRASILAALSITDELFQARAELERLRGEIETRVTVALETLASADDDDDP